MGNLHNNMDEIHKRVTLYFDNALGENERTELLQQVGQDPKYTKLFNKERTFREFLKDNVRRPDVSSDLIQNIKNKIRFT